MVEKTKAIFLDRDGIVNRAIIVRKKPYPPLKLTDTYPVEGIKELIKFWHELGYLVLVVTNQPDIASNLVTLKEVERINKYLQSLVGFDDAFICPHSNKDSCDCRKPKIGLFKQAEKKYNISLSDSFMIGDRWKDIEAGHNAGCTTIFVDYDYSEKKPENFDYIVKNVKEIKELKIKKLE